MNSMKLQRRSAAPTPMAGREQNRSRHPRPGTKAPPNAARAPCRFNSPQPPESYGARHTCRSPAAAPASPQGQRGKCPGAGSAAAACAGSASLAGHASAALGNRARRGLRAPAAHRAPSWSWSGPSLRAHTHLTSARIKARGAAPDGSPRRPRARFRCRRSTRTTRPREAHSSARRGCCKLEWVGRRRRGRETGGGGRTCRLTAALLWRPASHQQPLQPLPQVPIECEDQAAGARGCCPLPANENPDLEFSSPE